MGLMLIYNKALSLFNIKWNLVKNIRPKYVIGNSCEDRRLSIMCKCSGASFARPTPIVLISATVTDCSLATFRMFTKVLSSLQLEVGCLPLLKLKNSRTYVHVMSMMTLVRSCKNTV